MTTSTKDELVAVWYWCRYDIDVEVGPRDEIIGEFVVGYQEGYYAPRGVQYQDGTFNDWDKDPNVRRIDAKIRKEQAAVLKKASYREPPPQRTVRTPFRVRDDIGVLKHHIVGIPADMPEWVGLSIEEKP